MPSEILIYQAENQQTRIEVKLDGETVWADPSKSKMADLFQREPPNH